MIHSTVVILAIACSAPAALEGRQAQPVPQRLEAPLAALSEAFSAVRGVRELASGRVLVADWIEKRVALVDPAWAAGASALPDDSVKLVRLDPATGGTHVVAVLQGSRSRSDIRSPSLAPRIPIVGYASQDAWTLSSIGDLVIIRGDYHVDVVGVDGSLRSGPPYGSVTRPVTEADKSAFVVAPMGGSGSRATARREVRLCTTCLIAREGDHRWWSCPPVGGSWPRESVACTP